MTIRKITYPTKKKHKNSPVRKLRKVLSQIPLLNKSLIFLYRKINPDKNSLHYWIKKILSNSAIQVLQIGSNDGISGDPLNNLIRKNDQWQVLFVEPVPEVFVKLKNNYGFQKRFKFENSGINLDGRQQKFYQIGEEAYNQIADLSENYKQIGSFSRAQVEKLAKPELIEFIEELNVNCMSLEKLLQVHKIEKLDLIQVDAEGYDWKILSQLDLQKYQPEMIIFESLNLQEFEKEEAIKALNDTYFIFEMRIDYMCIRKDKLGRKDKQILSSRLVHFKKDEFAT